MNKFSLAELASKFETIANFSSADTALKMMVDAGSRVVLGDGTSVLLTEDNIVSYLLGSKRARPLLEKSIFGDADSVTIDTGDSAEALVALRTKARRAATLAAKAKQEYLEGLRKVSPYAGVFHPVLSDDGATLTVSKAAERPKKVGGRAESVFDWSPLKSGEWHFFKPAASDRGIFVKLGQKGWIAADPILKAFSVDTQSTPNSVIKALYANGNLAVPSRSIPDDWRGLAGDVIVAIDTSWTSIEPYSTKPK